MKVVLFCGGLGTRLREHSDTIPKPLVTIGNRPVVWHLMRYYAHFGHRDFVLCLGYRGDMIREYFLKYNDAMFNDFTLREGGRRIEVHGHDSDDWNITFVDTGLHSNIGQRLLRVQNYLAHEAEFLANYSDGLASIPLDQMIADFRGKQAVALAKSGETVSLAHTLLTEKADDNASPFEHTMLRGNNMDRYAIQYHGFAHSHIDALCHILYKDQTYNGYARADVNTDTNPRTGTERASGRLQGRRHIS